jgi:hypothetical protein
MKTPFREFYDWYLKANNWQRHEDKKHYEYQDILIKIEDGIREEKEMLLNVIDNIERDINRYTKNCATTEAALAYGHALSRFKEHLKNYNQ